MSEDDGPKQNLSMGSMLHSMRASQKHKKGSDLASSSSASSAAAASSSSSTPKVKKLSEKGKTKLATHRAHEKLLADTSAKEQAYADQHPDLIDENGEMEMPVEDDLFDDGLDGAGRLAKYVAEERKVIENEEMVRKLAKLQRKHNTMQNALLKGNKIGAGYDRDSVDLKVIQRQLKKNKKAEEEKTIYLEEALPVIRDACTAVAKGQKALYAFLDSEETLRTLQGCDIRYLRASLEATLERRPSPLNFRVEVLWRFAATVHEWRGGQREQNLRMAQYAYQLLLEKCDPELHPFQYAGLCNTLELCELELERVTGYKILNRANKDFEFAQPLDPSSNFNFERKASSSHKK